MAQLFRRAWRRSIGAHVRYRDRAYFTSERGAIWRARARRVSTAV
jgi:hypothetical protein